MNPLLIPPLVSIAKDVLARVLPDKAQAALASAEFEKQLSEIDERADKNFRDFVVAYEGSGDQVHPALQILRGSVRPVLTYTLALLYGWGFLHPTEFTPEQMTGLFQLNLISLGFWYGERALKKLGLDLGKKNG
jgi:hypothetical protein